MNITERSRLRRLPNRGSHERKVIHEILDGGLLAHVGFNINGQPFVIPTLFGRDGEKRLRLTDRLKQDVGSPWWFRTVTGTTPDGRKTLVIWRKLTGNPEQDNLVLDEWFTKQGYSTKDREFQLIYVNGDNNLENLKAPDDTWKVRLIEEDFYRLMFDTEGM